MLVFDDRFFKVHGFDSKHHDIEEIKDNKVFWYVAGKLEELNESQKNAILRLNSI